MTAAPPAPVANRLSIGHLLLWTATTGAALAWTIEWQRPRREFDYSHLSGNYLRLYWLQELLEYAVTPAYGLGLAAAVLAAWRLASRRPGFPTQPGHWVAVMVGIAAAGYAASEWRQTYVGDLLPRAAALVALVGTSFAAAARTPRPWRWSIPLWINALAVLVLGVLIATMVEERSIDAPNAFWLAALLPGLALVVSVGWLLVSSVFDLIVGERGDLYHWAGMAALAGIVAQPIAAAIAAMVLLG